MEYIRNIQSFNVPFEKSSNDRIVEDIDNKINKYKVEDISVSHFSHTITNTTTAVFTINGKRVNYLRIESDIFTVKKVSYWFLTDVAEIESDSGTRYNAKLDVLATFGLDIFNQLNGKEIEIERMHGERYVLENGKLVINKDHHSILNSDFNIDETVGNKVNYLGTNINHTGIYSAMEIRFVDINTPYHVTQGNATIYNEITVKNNSNVAGSEIRNFKYAILSGPSFRKYLWTDPQFKDAYDRSKLAVGSSAFERFMEIDNNTALGDIYIIPIYTPNGNARDKDSKTIKGNTIEWLQELPEGIVLSIIITSRPIQYEKQVFKEDGNIQVEGLLFEFLNTPEKFKNITGLFICPVVKNFDPMTILDIKNTDNNINLKDLIENNYGVKYEITTIPPSEEGLEIGVINNKISKTVLWNIGEIIEIDPYTLLKHGLKATHMINEIGYTQNFISGSHIHQTNEHKEITFFTDQGTTYLQTHKSQIEAQKKRIDLETKLQGKQTQISQTNAYGGGIVGGLLSALNPASWTANILQNQALDINKDIASARKSEIDAQISDASASPSIINMAKENSKSILMTDYDAAYTFRTTIANKLILNKIINYYKLFATPFKSITAFNISVWKNMFSFNYLKVPRVKEYITGSGDIDMDIIDDISQDMSAGIRIWHNDRFDITEMNLENTINTYFNP